MMPKFKFNIYQKNLIEIYPQIKSNYKFNLRLNLLVRKKTKVLNYKL